MGDRAVAVVEDSPKPPPRRLTLTLPVVAGAELVVVVVALGRAKAEIIREAIEDPSSPLPVGMVARQARRATFLLDPEAASLLRGR